ncbi:MAG: SDR family NAD(P)-dependent oxidoreductase [Gammaproteobacteria bacterium]|nr:SDR family NAD(P)-dependent oxidoreductase [Gammaproteobacteria bacterium]
MDRKSILITGCSSGIGLCVAEGLAARGYRVFATARQQHDVAQLRERGLRALQLDVTDSAMIREVVAQVVSETGGTLYALFNNAGYAQPGAVEDLQRAWVRDNFETNVFGPWELTNRVIPIMRKQGYGRIIQNSSVLGIIALPFRGAYNASKYAIEGWSDTLRLELHGSGIHVSLIEPGPILSKFRANAFAMYKKNVDPQSSYFREVYWGMERRLTKKGPAAPFTLPPEAVLQAVIAALESANPRPRYRVTVPTSLFAWLKRVLSTRTLDRLLRKVSRDEN